MSGCIQSKYVKAVSLQSTWLCKQFLTRKWRMGSSGHTQSHHECARYSSNLVAQAIFDTQTSQVNLWKHTFSSQVCADTFLGGSNALRTVRAMTVSPDGLYIAIAEDGDSPEWSRLDGTQVGYLSKSS